MLGMALQGEAYQSQSWRVCVCVCVWVCVFLLVCVCVRECVCVFRLLYVRILRLHHVSHKRLSTPLAGNQLVVIVNALYRRPPIPQSTWCENFTHAAPLMEYVRVITSLV